MTRHSRVARGESYLLDSLELLELADGGMTIADSIC